MTSNFSFLKKVDKDLFEIIETAEKLYRDEYFEQSMTQTRRFGENVCKNVLGNKRTSENTFDDMLATLKDSAKEIQEKEFIEDLYFLKKHGNKSAHAVKVQHDGMEALECLKRAFEIAISYCVYNKGSSKNILKLRYDVELLVTGNKTKKNLAEKYNKEKKKTAKPVKQSYNMKSKKQKTGISKFWIFVGISSILSLITIALLELMLIFS